MTSKTASTPFATVLFATPLLVAVLFAAALLAASPILAEPLATTGENGSVVEFTKLVLDPKAKTWTGFTSDGQTKTYSSETASFETVAGILKCEWKGLSFFADKKELAKDRVNLGWEYDGWSLGGGDETTPAGVVHFKDAKRKPVKVDLMVFMPEFSVWRFETAPPVEDVFSQLPQNCDVLTKAGIFLPEGEKMFLYWPADDAKRANGAPIAISRAGETFVLEHGELPAHARAKSGK